MKYKTTKKAVTNGYYKIIRIHYCDLQYLLRYRDANAYTCGVYGWNADIYDFGNVAIVTGYRSFGNVCPDYELVREYNEKAKPICESWTTDYNTKKEQLDKLLYEFIAKCMV